MVKLKFMVKRHTDMHMVKFMHQHANFQTYLRHWCNYPARQIQKPVLSVPFAWLAGNLVAFALAAALLRRTQARAAAAAAGPGGAVESRAA